MFLMNYTNCLMNTSPKVNQNKAFHINFRLSFDEKNEKYNRNKKRITLQPDNNFFII